MKLRPRTLSRLVALTPRRCALLAEGSAELALAAVLIRVRPFKRTLAFGNVKLGKDSSSSPEELARIIERAARFAPLRAVCFQQGIAFQRMARRRGIDARLHYGVRTFVPSNPAGHEDKQLQAHVWITVNGMGVLGEEQAIHFRELLQSPA